MTVHVQTIKLEQELLQYRLSLEGDDAVLVPLVPAIQHRPVNCSGDPGQEATFLAVRADSPHRICIGIIVNN